MEHGERRVYNGAEYEYIEGYGDACCGKCCFLDVYVPCETHFEVLGDCQQGVDTDGYFIKTKELD